MYTRGSQGRGGRGRRHSDERQCRWPPPALLALRFHILSLETCSLTSCRSSITCTRPLPLDLMTHHSLAQRQRLRPLLASLALCAATAPPDLACAATAPPATRSDSASGPIAALDSHAIGRLSCRHTCMFRRQTGCHHGYTHRGSDNIR